MRRASYYLALAGLSLLGAAGAADAAPGIPWAKSFQAAMDEAKKSNRLVMADFYTDW
jgi:hypothetical protein